MRNRLLAASGALAIAVSAIPAARAAELVTLRNGFQMRCDHYTESDGHIRIYLSPGGDNYIDLNQVQVASVIKVPNSPVDPASKTAAIPPDRASAATLSQADLAEMLAKAGQKHDLDVDLLASVIDAESAGNPRAVSSAGAQGLMQLMPATAASLGVKNSFQPQQNINGGSAYLDQLLTLYGNNLALALAAYNAGPEAVARYHGIPPYPETRAYVARVIHEFNRRVLARETAERRVRQRLSSSQKKTPP